MRFAKGDQARLTGLERNRHLNGERVDVLGFDEPSGRFMVRTGWGSSSQDIRVRPDRLLPLH